MPGNRPHHTDKWRSCVDKVMGQGHDESSASAICTVSLQKAGEPIFVGAASRSAEEFRLLGDAPGHEFHGNQYSGGNGIAAKDTARAERASNLAIKPPYKMTAGMQAQAHQDAALAHMEAATTNAKAAAEHQAAGRHSEASIARDQASFHTRQADYHHAGSRGEKLGKSPMEKERRRTLGAIEEIRHLHLLGALGKAKTLMHEGREHLVVPVVALMEGVIHAVNAVTPEFVSLETLKKAAASWAGKPVTLGHPKKDGKQCSANSPDVLAAHGMGFVKNPRIEGKKLLCEAWIDKLKAKALHPGMYDRLLAGEREEVSVGAYVVTDNKAGEFKGKPFMASWLETAGDHLAFLPGGRGACSIDMGCGAHRAAMRVLEDKFEVLQPLDTPDTPEAAASEEAAELIAYQSLRTLMDGVGDQWDQASKLIDDLIADEEENPTETPAQEEAEEEVEAARLDGIRAFCQSMIGGLSGIVSATYSSALMPDPVPASDPRYMAAKNCSTCDGSGQVKDGKKQADCPTCDGSGKMMTAEARALLGSRHSKSDMAIIQNVHDHAMALGATCDRSNYKMLGAEKPCGCKKEEQFRTATIRNEGGKWILYTKDGSRKLGQHNTEAEAVAQEKAIEAAKLRRASETATV